MLSASMSSTAAGSDEEHPLLDSSVPSSTRSSSLRREPVSREPLRQSLQLETPDERTALLSAPPLGRSYSSPGVKARNSSVASLSKYQFPRSEWRVPEWRTPGWRTPGPRPSFTPAYRPPVGWGAKLAAAMHSSWNSGQNSLDQLTSSKHSLLFDERVWYDQYTSTDWVRDSIIDNFRVRDLRALKGIRGRCTRTFDAAQGWILVFIIGLITAFIAYFVDLSENAIFDIKEGYCIDGWHKSKGRCCYNEDDCPLWRSWGDVLQLQGIEKETIDLLLYLAFVLLFAVSGCMLTLTTKTVVSSNVSLPAFDEDLGGNYHSEQQDDGRKGRRSSDELHASPGHTYGKAPPPITYYPAAGSGVAEVKVILSGFVLHGYLGFKTLVIKTLGLVLAVASGMSLGKEGPFVHIATCVGNIASRLFAKYRDNDAKRREVLSASAASGVAVAFGAPLGGTLFSLEEVSYYFPFKTLFRTFFCCIAAALSLKFFNPYGTGKIVIFEVRYSTNWEFFEMAGFMLLGLIGGALGALFIKASRLWARTFRRISYIRKMPILEVFIVALITGLLQYWNRYTKQPVTQLLSNLASPCTNDTSKPSSLCPTTDEEFKETAKVLLYAFLIKAFLTTITFGIKVPAGIYIPSMVVGGILGRLFGHGVQYLTRLYPHAPLWAQCNLHGGAEACVTPGVYALVAAGATMCGVTRLSITLTVILFELTGSLDHVLPFSLAILIAKWTADAIEPLSIYDLLTEMNRYPFLDNKTHPVFTSTLGDITPRVRTRRVIDISRSRKLPVSKLRKKLLYLHAAGEVDGGLPVVRDGLLVGLLPAPDLEFALDKLNRQFAGDSTPTPESEEDELGLNNIRDVQCLMTSDSETSRDDEFDSDDTKDDTKTFDLTDFVDPAPVALDVHSPMDLVYQCFVKLGLRYICVVKNGHYAGMVHKKAFVKYIRDLDAGKEI